MSQLGKVDEKSSLNISLAYLLQIIVVSSAAAWAYFSVNEKIDNNAQETRNLRGNQNNYIFPDIRTLEQQVIALEKDVLVLKAEIEFYKQQQEKNEQ
jgi:hypothetical protein|tara:strand:- start:407 stop:697 length:291 start_codon:yes stop_codon:yes gene_type:complete